MSVARGYGINGKSYYTNVAGPRVTHSTFTVNHTDAGGLGITSLKSNGFIRNVFMNTNQTPGANDGYTNPNPAAGYAMVQFKNNFNAYLTSFSGFISTTTGSIKIDNSALTAGVVYVITTLGNATLAKWQAIGVPAGVVPAVGVSFVALNNGGSGNTLTSRVSTISASGITNVELVGNPNTTLNNSNIASNGGAYLLLAFMAPSVAGTISTPTITMDSYTPAGTNAAGSVAVTSGTAGNAVTLNAGTTLEATGGGTVPVTSGAFAGTPAVLTGTISTPTFTSTSVMAAKAPADGCVCSLTFYYDGSSVTVDGL